MNRKVLVIKSQFNTEITSSLLENALTSLKQSGIAKEDIRVQEVPGAFEIPVIASKALHTKSWDSVICLGCVIRGETPHFDYICSEVTRALMDLSVKFMIPISFGILTTDTLAQARRRAGLEASEDAAGETLAKRVVENKGLEAAEAAIQMMDLTEKWQGDRT